MSSTPDYPTPGEVQNLLAGSPDPSRPLANVATLEALFAQWPYARGLELWEGYIHADLVFQLGWARFHAADHAGALAAWRLCPWPECAEGERAALGHLLNVAQAQQSLVLAPPVADVLSRGEALLSELLSAVDDPSSRLALTAAGNGYILESRLMRADGVHALRLEFDAGTLYYVSLLPVEVQARLSTARAFFQMGEAEEAGSWMLRAAHACQQAGQESLAFSFLQKGRQLAPHSEAIDRSLQNLESKGVEATFSSRVVAERSLHVPAELSRAGVRPSTPPRPDYPDLEQLREAARGWVGEARNDDAFIRCEDGEPPLVLVHRAELTDAQGVRQWLHWSLQREVPALLVPTEWRAVLQPFPERLEKQLCRTRALGVESLGRWTGDHRAAIGESLEEWFDKAGDEQAQSLLPESVTLVLVGVAQAWQVPLLLNGCLGTPQREVLLAAWFRRLAQRFRARPVALTEWAVWLYLPELPETRLERSRLLAETLNLSQSLGETPVAPEPLQRCGDGWLLTVAVHQA